MCRRQPSLASGSRPSVAGAHLLPSGAAIQEASYICLLELRRFCRNVLGPCSQQETIGFKRLAVHLFERGNVVIPLKKGCGGAASLDCSRVQPPYRIKDGMVMGVERVLLEF